MKVIQDIELLKKLQEYITFETEYYMKLLDITSEIDKEEKIILTPIETDIVDYEDDVLKTLTTDEAIEFFLHKGPNNLNLLLTLFEDNLSMIMICKINEEKKEVNIIETITGIKIEAIEKMLNYLIDNNLLGKQK